MVLTFAFAPTLAVLLTDAVLLLQLVINRLLESVFEFVTRFLFFAQGREVVFRALELIVFFIVPLKLPLLCFKFFLRHCCLNVVPLHTILIVRCWLNSSKRGVVFFLLGLGFCFNLLLLSLTLLVQLGLSLLGRCGEQCLRERFSRLEFELFRIQIDALLHILPDPWVLLTITRLLRCSLPDRFGLFINTLLIFFDLVLFYPRFQFDFCLSLDLCLLFFLKLFKRLEVWCFICLLALENDLSFRLLSRDRDFGWGDCFTLCLLRLQAEIDSS